MNVHRRESIALRALACMTLCCALGALVLQEPVAAWSAATAVALVITAPLARVVGLVVRWQHDHDYHFVALAVALVALVAAGATLTAITS